MYPHIVAYSSTVVFTGDKMKAEFWKHIEFFHCHQALKDISSTLCELRGIIMAMHVDILTSKASAVTYDQTELGGLMANVKDIIGEKLLGLSNNRVQTVYSL